MSTAVAARAMLPNVRNRIGYVRGGIARTMMATIMARVIIGPRGKTPRRFAHGRPESNRSQQTIWADESSLAFGQGLCQLVRQQICQTLIEGNISVCILEREEGEVAHFITMTSWSSLEAIKSFAGDDAERAKYYPEDQDFLLEFEPTVVHYEVVDHS